MELASEMLIRSARMGKSIEEIQTHYRQRIGESKLETWSDGWRHLLLITLLAPDLLLIGPGLTLVGLGVAMLIFSFLSPEGVTVGSITWQPIFFSGISIVLGTQALLAGVVLAHNSSLSSSGLEHRFAFIGRPAFPGRCVIAGVVMIVIGLLLNGLLFTMWLGDKQHSSLSHFGLASLSQAFLIIGGTVASFGVVSRFLRAYAARDSVSMPSEDDDRTSVGTA
jgi:hypothetical protein